MDKAMIDKISRKVRRQFPEMTGVQPSVRQSGDENRYVLTYKGTANLPGGHTLRRVVRVTADQKGHVLRMSTSK